MEAVNYIFSEATIHAIGWTLLHALWQGGIFAIALALALIYMRQFSSWARYLIAVIFIFLFFSASLVTFIMVYDTTGAKPEEQGLTITQPEVVDNDLVRNSGKNESNAEEKGKGVLDNLLTRAEIYFDQHLPLIVSIWLLGVLLLSLKFLGGLAYVQRLKYHKTAPLSPYWQNKFEGLVAKINLPRKVLISKSYLATSPLAIGIFKPAILLPAQVLTGLNEKQIEAIIAHELAHIKRNDFAVNILQSLLEIMFFYHPAIWWMSSVVRNERENSCDDIAVDITGERFDFARALVNIRENQLVKKGLPAVSFSGNKSNFTQRIKRILNKPTIFADFKEGFVTAMLIIIGLGIVVFSAFKFSGGEKQVYLADVSQSYDLHQAVEENNLSIARQLIQNGADLEDKEDDYTPLMLAVKENKYEMSKLLIENGANVNALEDDDRTMLIEAGDEDDPRITELLIKNGALVNATNDDGWTALLEATENEKYEIAKILVENGADLEMKDEDGRTPLMLAVQENNYELAEFFLGHNADIHVTNKDGWTILMHAADEDDERLVSLLIENGARVNARTISGWTALLEAVENGEYQNAKILIDNGAEVKVTYEAFTPLRYAVQNNNYMLTQLLIAHGADVNAKGNENGTTILIEAAEEDNAQITELLLQKGARVNEAQYNGKTALFEAIDEGKETIAQKLINHGARVNGVNYNGLTPLMYAIEKENFEMVIMLVENGADLNAKSKSGWSVWEIAQEEDDEEILEFLAGRLN